MNKIKILDETVSNIIAAGEVVENPASMIKELIENSLDAEASMISIQVANSGRNVKISDNGYGMSREDLFLSIERHATSKIATKDDIFNLYTYGFRGEALASIASVAKLNLSSRTKDDEEGCRLHVKSGNITKVEACAKQIGTDIEVKDLFFNTPARLKFLRSKGTEYGKIKNIVLCEALANYNTAFSLTLDDKEVIKTSGRGLQNTIVELFSPQVLKNMTEFEMGLMGNMNILRSSKDYIFTYINGRYAKSAIIEKAVIDAYYTKLMKGKYPFVILFLNLDPKEIDVNVHPSKKIVKFSNDTKVYSLVKNSMESAMNLSARELVPDFEITEEKSIKENEKNHENSDIPDFLKKNNDFIKKDEYISENKAYNNFKTELIKSEVQQIPQLKEKEQVFLNEKVEEYKSSKSNNKKETVISTQETKVEEVLQSKKEEKERTKYKIIGQLRNMYILVEGENSLEIYDQHIVHERILYEELKEKHYIKNMSSQNLLVPIKLQLDYRERELVDSNMEIFRDFGYEIEDFGAGEILIRSVPIFDFREGITETFREILRKISEGDHKDIREDILISMSCKNAIKAGEILSFEEMSLLLEKLHKIGKYTCPHGRPIIIKLSNDEIDKMFGRK
jgi:DNA mismatch repair protein MutL